MPKLVKYRSLPVFVALSLVLIVVAAFVASRRSQADAGEPSFSKESQPALTPAGKLIVDAATGLAHVAPLTMNFVRTPDATGPDGKGRYLIAVNSGFGVEFNSKSKGQQTLSVIDLSLKPDPKVVQTVYFYSPQSANFGLAFDTKLQADGKYRLFLAGGFENKIWIIGFDPSAAQPLSPGNKPDEKFGAASIDVSAFAENAPSPDYNGNVAAVYPMGVAVSPDGETIYSANNLGDTLGIVSDLRSSRKISRINLRRPGSEQFVYPYDVKVLTDGKRVSKAYVSLWGDATIAVVDAAMRVAHIAVDRHPTAMLFNKSQTRLMVVNSDADTVSVIDTKTNKVIEKINVRLNESAKIGASPEGLALSEDEKTLYVANAHANAVAVVSLESGVKSQGLGTDTRLRTHDSRLLGFIPTGSYASAVAVVGNRLFVANGKGTGMENSSNIVNDTGRYPNMPNRDFPGETYNKRGLYSVAIVSGNISLVDVPGEKELFAYTQAAMRNNGLLGREKSSIFGGGSSPFKHIIYIIRENRTYDQVLGDVAVAGNGQKADGDGSVAIFGGGEAAKSPSGTPQKITPNARALAMRFGLLDRYFVNSEASPDGHNWSTAAFSSDYVDKAFRWNYSGRGRTYDYEGFNRLPSFNPPSTQPPVALPSVFNLPATENDIANFLKKYVPYLNGARDISEPETLYLWDAASRAGLSYRNYGEFVATVSSEDVREVNTRQPKKYPDLSPNLTAFAVKKSLEGHFSPIHRNFDMDTPDSFTTESYKQASEINGPIDPAITGNNGNAKFRGTSRYGAWADEFRGFVSDLQSGKGDKLPNLSIVRFSNDHTAGLRRGTPTPQFYVADNDYAVGRLVEDVSKSPYWKDTAIFIVEDDAQDGPDHVDAHRSPALVISAYNRTGALVHEFHNTVSLIRTIELCLGIEPMNFLDANAVPIDIFTSRPNLDPYTAVLPTLALDNLYPPDKPTPRVAYYMDMTDRQDLKHPDMADPREMNEIIWFSVKGDRLMPTASRLPAFDLMRAGLKMEAEKQRGNGDED